MGTASAWPSDGGVEIWFPLRNDVRRQRGLTAGRCGYLPKSHGARCLTLEELNLASRNFSNANFIGHGMFGEVYKGLLQDGTIVAVKRRHSPPSQEFVQEHRNLVKLLGYCQENGMQMLVYEYIPNGSVSTHLHGNSHAPGVRLEFKHRLSIAHGTAKDNRMTGGFTSESMKELLRLTSWCVNPMSGQRPSMSLVEAEIHRIREQEISLTTVMTGHSPTVTLGSQLFRTSR
ncbi:hypothetical protein C2845_PM03G35000 [Panicum miliaceum]|uniref:non-specific serine/threonine protein kinase n=1 Tax=Panicum miliaceum TaxID=4540 RepID=A0A3L6TDM5_PANMI|nr:hypothetical protein C2845_PM03G35000 [Panicum miliaceum]